MSKNALEERENALEEQFFKNQNEALLQKLKAAKQKEATFEELKRITGIQTPAVLEQLVDMKIGASAALVLSLYPLVEVAWADGAVQPNERQVILDEASKAGISLQSEGGELLEQWLSRPPPPSWHGQWVDYVKALGAGMTPAQRDTLKTELLGRARKVAEAAGGILGLGFAVSSGEKAVLEALEKAF